MIAICLPSRGLVFSKTMESVVNGIKTLTANGYETSLFMSHDLPIPQSHNHCVELALQWGAHKKLIFIEEDHYLFPDAWLELAKSDFDVTTMQYNDKNGSPHGIIHYNEAGEVLWGGLGSTAIKREVFEKLGHPYFRIDHMYKNTKKHLKDGKMITEYEEMDPKQEWDGTEFKEKRDEYKYGGLDIDFYTRARNAKFTIGVIENHKSHHFKLVQLGDPHTNNGTHVIEQV